MKEDVFEVLMYLFENYMLDGSEEQPDQETLMSELALVGFADGEIDKAFNWLEDLSLLCEAIEKQDPCQDHGGFRILTAAEQTKLGLKPQGLLLSLENSGVLDAKTRELVLDRAMALEVDEVDLEQLRWVILMVLCNRPGDISSVPWAEDLVADGIPAHLH